MCGSNPPLQAGRTCRRNIQVTRLTIAPQGILITDMLFTNESGTPKGHTRPRTDSRPAPPHDMKRSVLFHRGEGRAVSFSGRVAGLCLTRHVGRIDARLCPDGRVPAPDAVIDPLINGGESIKTGEISDVYRPSPPLETCDTQGTCTPAANT